MMKYSVDLENRLNAVETLVMFHIAQYWLKINLGEQNDRWDVEYPCRILFKNKDDAFWFYMVVI